jgi:hypothetical protein
MIISFYSLKNITFFNLFSAFFKKLAEQTYLSRFLSCKEKLCSAKKRDFLWRRPVVQTHKTCFGD